MKYVPYFLTSLVVIFTGCATFGTYETARVAPRGTFQGGGAITPVHITTTVDIWTGQKTLGFLFFPIPELSGKIGVSDNFELGARWAFGPGLTATGKYQFLRGPIDGAVSFYGTLYGYSLGGVTLGYYTLEPRFIVSNESPETFPYSVNAGINWTAIFSGAGGQSASAGVLSAVAGVGLPFRLGATRSFRIMPELSLILPLVGSVEAGEASGSVGLLGNFAMSFGVGFGSAGPYEWRW